MSATQGPLSIRKVAGVVLTILGILLLAVAVGTYAGGSYAHDYVASELKRQRITFAQDMSKEPEALRPFAGQIVDTGPEAKAYATMIEGHIAKATNGRTFSEISKAARQNSKDQSLQKARSTALEGNTVYGALQNAYGWWLLGSITMWMALGLAVVGLLFLLGGVMLVRDRTHAHTVTK